MAPLCSAHGLPGKKFNLADVIVGIIWLGDLDATVNFFAAWPGLSIFAYFAYHGL